MPLAPDMFRTPVPAFPAIRIPYLLETFCRFGAPPEIAYLQRPHIGTDRLRGVVMGLRRFLEEKGVEFKFRTKMTGLQVHGGRVRGVVMRPSILGGLMEARPQRGGSRKVISSQRVSVTLPRVPGALTRCQAVYCSG